MRELIAVTKALADESRLRLVAALAVGELCVCQLVELLELAPSTVSKHLALLRAAGLLEVRKDGRWAYYELAGPDASPLVRRALELVTDALADSPRAACDAARLEEILRVDPEVLCSQKREALPTGARPRGAAASSSSARATRPAARSRRPGRARSTAR